MFESVVDVLRPEPHPLKIEIMEERIPFIVVAKYIDRSYIHTLNMLNSVSPLQPKYEEKIRRLIQTVKQEKGI